MFWRFRHDLGKDLPIVAGQVRQLSEYTETVNTAIQKIAKNDPLIATIEVQDLTFDKDREGKPNVHFNGPGCDEMGKRMAAAYAKLRASVK